jgi:hypothetical protein
MNIHKFTFEDLSLFVSLLNNLLTTLEKKLIFKKDYHKIINEQFNEYKYFKV